MTFLKVELSRQNYRLRGIQFNFRARYDDGTFTIINSYETVEEIAREIKEHITLKETDRRIAIFDWEGDRPKYLKQPGRKTERPKVADRTKLLKLLIHQEEINAERRR